MAAALFLALILFILFETNALVEYAKLLKLKRVLPNFNSYQEIISAGGHVHYLNFLRKTEDNFLVRLVTCPVCLSVPFSIIFSIISLNIFNYPYINFFSLFGYFLLKLLNKYSVNN